jgi:hypothetical protein
MNSKRTWVLVADKDHASVFEAQANHPDPTPVEEKTFSANLRPNDHLVIVAPPLNFGRSAQDATQKRPEQGDGRAGTGPPQDTAQ